ELYNILPLDDKRRRGLHPSQRGQLISACQTLIHRIAPPGIPKVLTGDTPLVKQGVDAICAVQLTGLLEQHIGIPMQIKTLQHAKRMEQARAVHQMVLPVGWHQAQTDVVAAAPVLQLISKVVTGATAIVEQFNDVRSTLDALLQPAIIPTLYKVTGSLSSRTLRLRGINACRLSTGSEPEHGE